MRICILEAAGHNKYLWSTYYISGGELSNLGIAWSKKGSLCLLGAYHLASVSKNRLGGGAISK